MRFYVLGMMICNNIIKFTGSTWAQEMIWLIGHDLDYEGAKALQQVIRTLQTTVNRNYW